MHTKRILACAGAIALATSTIAMGTASAAKRKPRCFGEPATKVGTKGRDEISGTRGPDVIVTKGGRDDVIGRGGDDLICTGGGSDFVDGGGGDDRINGGGGPDTLVGNKGDDLLVLGRGAFQTAVPGPGNDTVRGSDAGAFPFDFVDYFEAPSGVTVDLEAGTATGHGTDRLVSIDGIAGSQSDDTLLGTDGANFLFGHAGNDTIDGRGNAADVDDPEDIVASLTYDAIAGDADGLAAPGNDTITGGEGFTVIFHDAADGPVTVDMVAGTSVGEGSDTFSGVAAIAGTEFDDTITGNSGTNFIDPAAGNDSVDGGDGEDTLIALDGLESTTIDLAAGTASGTYRTFTAQGEGQAAFDWTLSNFENAWGGGEAANTISGDDGPNELYGGFLDDSLFGLGGDDLLVAGPDGNDSADGGDGTDTCRAFDQTTGCEEDVPGSFRSLILTLRTSLLTLRLR